MGFISACYSQVSRTLQQIGEMFSSPTAVKTMAVAAASIGAYSLYSLSQNGKKVFSTISVCLGEQDKKMGKPFE